MRYVCVFLCLAAFSPAAAPPVQGEVTGEGINDYSNFTVETYAPGSAFSHRASVGIDGRFEFRDLPQGHYMFRVTDRFGDTVYQQYGPTSATEPLTLRLPRATGQRPTSGAISVQELQHRPLKAAVKAFNKSVERNEAGDLAASLALLEKSVSIDPNYVPALNNLGARYTRLGRFADAAVAFERAITQAPSNPMLHANFAHALLHLREYLRAETAARRSVELDRSYAPAAYYLGLSLLSQKKVTAETIVWLRKGRTLGDRAELALGAALAHTGSHREAREVLEGCQNASEPAVAAEARLLLSRLP